MTPSRRPTRSRCSSRTCAASSRRRASRGYCTRSGGPATSSAPSPFAPLARASARISASFDRLPIRLRLAGVSALLTFVILCAFAVAIGSLTVHRIRTDFNRDVAATAKALPSQVVHFTSDPLTSRLRIEPPLSELAPANGNAVIRIFDLTGNVLDQAPKGAPSLGPPVAGEGRTING